MKVLIFVVAYNAEKTLCDVLDRIPPELGGRHETDILIIDDFSADATFGVGHEYIKAGKTRYEVTILRNPVNQGYGGNQKLGYHYAIRQGYDAVVLLHGDGQYAPERVLDLIEPIARGEADAVFGSRMIPRGEARKGGMPLYKYVGNRVLTWYQNWLLKASLSEYHSGYRAYRVDALKNIPFEYNTNDFHFDTEIIIQLMNAEYRIHEVAIPTYYGDEICYVNGLKYAWNVVRTVAMNRAQDYGVLYDRKYDCRRSKHDNRHYHFKEGYASPHSMSVSLIRPGSRVLDLGCGAGYIGGYLKQRKSCHVVGIDRMPIEANAGLDHTIVHDLNNPDLPVEARDFDYILLLDIIEHLSAPESLMEKLREAAASNRETLLLISVPNVAFLPVRLMLLLGQFNYGKRGILDRTHTRLFTFRSLRHFLRQTGYEPLHVRGVPAPFQLIWGKGLIARFFMMLNRGGIWFWKAMFSYQIFAVAKPLPTLEMMLHGTIQHTNVCLSERDSS